ncbi:NAD-dependent epimerase/dehydratase family protein [Gammaproteobacteria bacterium AB-CW1]|uniref:NAD-dependent epimerase/dehydratase family protein n=1 Tax=Natronospira elongata TaxID=3110268 RepID=A0AAP6JDI3_9GAMM|nr:NAD-dependent epimerase/dehydratase family protein [Gammaproteobacteria bacterium AB-CW1]
MQAEQTQPPLLIVGYGYSGDALARRWLTAGGAVLGLSRTPPSDAPEGMAWQGIDLDRLQSPPPAILPDTRVVWLAPPPRQGRTDPRLLQGMRWLLQGGRPERLVYASTTSVYGRAEGRVDESTPAQPSNDRGLRRLDAENTALALGREQGMTVVRLRIAAIYGPGRLPEARLRAGKSLDPILASRPSNRIHRDDLAEALFLAALRAPADSVYNVSDNNPIAFGDYLDLCADLMGLPRPPRASTEGDSAAGFLQAQRALDASRLQRELGLRLRWPDPAVAVPAIVQSSAPA